jgi:hypothetical protein
MEITTMNKKLIVCIGIVLALLIFSYPILAAATANVAIEKDDQNRPTVIIEQGKGKEAGLVKVTNIHYAKSEGKARTPKTDPCYKLAGWKWTKTIQYITSDVLVDAITKADNEWDNKTTKTLFTNPVLGAYPWNTYDGKNSISFGNYPTANVIAVTVTWYKPTTKEAVESDILFDTDFTWGNATVNSGVMDLQNIATHEIGHTLGLSDLYTSSCSAVTMYGYSGYGETYKRTIEIPDITGLQKIYGS